MFFLSRLAAPYPCDKVTLYHYQIVRNVILSCLLLAYLFDGVILISTARTLIRRVVIQSMRYLLDRCEWLCTNCVSRGRTHGQEYTHTQASGTPLCITSTSASPFSTVYKLRFWRTEVKEKVRWQLDNTGCTRPIQDQCDYRQTSNA